MVDWIKTNSPEMLDQLWPQIESSTIVAWMPLQIVVDK
jgi:hypothetical protein